MFLKIPVFKRLIKQAYKTVGITLGHTIEPEGLYISGGWWMIWHQYETVPKEVKAAVIEICGDLPEMGKMVRVMKNGADQYELEDTMVDVMGESALCSISLKVTPVIYMQGDTAVRIMQDEDCHVTAVQQVIIDMIDKLNISEESGETQIIGPVCDSDYIAVYWGNNICGLKVGARLPCEEDVPFWRHLTRVDM